MLSAWSFSFGQSGNVSTYQIGSYGRKPETSLGVIGFGAIGRYLADLAPT
jgi:phosphoglycerate dehydrogenase-like enzyme